MFEVESTQGDATSPIKQRLRSTTKGVKRTFEESLSPVKKRHRMPQVKETLTMLPVKRRKVGNLRNSSRKNVETLGEEQLVERRARRRHPMSQVKETLSISPVKRRRVENPRNSSHMNVETLGEEQLVERRARRRQPMSQVKEVLPVPPVKRQRVENPRNSPHKNLLHCKGMTQINMVSDIMANVDQRMENSILAFGMWKV